MWRDACIKWWSLFQLAIKRLKFILMSFFITFNKQKQPPRGVLRKRWSENMQQICRRAPMPKCDFNKVALFSNFIEITLRHGCSLANFLHIFRTPFSRNTFGWLLLNKVNTNALMFLLLALNMFWTFRNVFL